ncbi:hypothetical protein DNK48_27595 [Streptomyces malaysiensis subsp. malaysiensis]|uniref:DUF5719 family protein n=1 Tax=Streptomyces malaysiensis TaxID=92644 RepID=UPI000BFE25B3|nr:DUF5719 family protein [Streptomyces malaysiensis]ATL83371.1 secreted protein [Streptomyces malaysiensis]QDL72480.1 hypothetical protein DNK48_27595 [Streptomyces malaysiensis]
MNRTTLSLIGAATALAAISGVAALTGGSSEDAGSAGKAATRLPVQRSTLLCPTPSTSDVSSTTYTAYTPKRDGVDAKDGTAELLPAQNAADDVTDPGGDGKGDKNDKNDKSGKDGGKGGDKPVLPLKEPGKPVTTDVSSADAPALIGTADGRFAPGWTVQQTTTIDAGSGRGILGTACTAPDTDFWFPGVSTDRGRQDFVHLTNPDDAAAEVDLKLYGPSGRLKSATDESITVPPRSTLPVLLSTLTDQRAESASLRVTARSGRIGAEVQAVDQKAGSDWLPPSAVPSSSVAIPGIPKDATSARLVVFAPGSDDADLKVRLAGPNNSITPAGHESLHVKSGMTAAIDLGDVTKGEPGSLLLTPEGGEGPATPVVAALQVTRGKGGDQETAFIPATAAIERSATAADNRTKGSTLSLVAPRAAAKVRITASAGAGGGSPVSKTYEVKGGTTKALEPPRPASGKGPYAVTVERLSGGPVHASRMLELTQDGVPMFTIQSLPDDRGTVVVPEAGQNMSLLNDD